MRKTLSIAALLFATCFAVSDVAAQVSRVPNSGCPNAQYPQPVGSPQIGQGFGVIAPPCRTPNAPQGIIIGVPSRTVVFNRPITCVDRCLLVTNPIATFPGGAWRTLIPNDRRLVGVCFRVQTFCIEQPALGRPCAIISGAIDVCIQR